MAKPIPNKTKPNSKSRKSDLLNKPANTKWLGWIVFFTAFGFYFTSIWNQYCLDDTQVILENIFTKKGWGGIVDILTKDSRYGFIGPGSTFFGIRYRPLSMVSFAVEWQYFKNSPYISHFINVLLYSFTALFFFKFLKKYIFKTNLYAAFTAAVLFAIHPIHTEVVDNIKSRDELMALLGSLAALYSLFNYIKTKGIGDYLFSLLFFFLALFSKENAFTYLAVMPLAVYLFSDKKGIKILLLIIPYLILAGIFILIRFSVVHSAPVAAEGEILNSPYLAATAVQKYATIFLVLLLYVKLLFIPYPLSHDYLFNQIPYTNFTDYRVILSLIIYFGSFAWALLNVRRKKIPAFGILYYLFTLSIASNIFLDVSSPMGERFLYMPSVGFCIFISWLLWEGVAWVKSHMPAYADAVYKISYVLAGIIIMLFGIITFSRAEDWKNNYTLFFHDADVVPNSAPANMCYGWVAISFADSIGKNKIDSLSPDKKIVYLNQAIAHLNKAISIYPKYRDAYVNLATAYLKIKKFHEANMAMAKAREIDPKYTTLTDMQNALLDAYIGAAEKSVSDKDYKPAIQWVELAKEVEPNNAKVIELGNEVKKYKADTLK